MRHFFKLSLLLLIILPISIFAQNYAEGCDGSRYAYEVFTGFTKSTVKYATAVPENADLYVVIYQPENDAVTKRPLIIFAHGGSFISGNKSDMTPFCEYFSKRGFVVASIQYRLLAGFPTPTAFTNAALKAVSDMKGSYRFFKSDAANANNYKIDTTKIFIGGLSAGAITALHASYLDENDNIDPTVKNLILASGGFSGNTGDAENRSHADNDIFGTLNMSGAVLATGILDLDEPFLMSYHGDKDDVVPIDSNSVFGLIYLYGSRTIHKEADAIGLPNTLTVAAGGLHTDIYTDPKYTDDLNRFLSASVNLYYPLLCGQTASNNESTQKEITTHVYPNPAREIVNFKFGKIVDHIWIMDSKGNVVINKPVNADNFRLSDHGLLPGSYFMVPIADNERYRSVPFSILK